MIVAEAQLPFLKQSNYTAEVIIQATAAARSWRRRRSFSTLGFHYGIKAAGPLHLFVPEVEPEALQCRHLLIHITPYAS
jgi:hypothetical protein